MAETGYGSPEGSRAAARRAPSRNEGRNEIVANPDPELSYSYSSSSSSYIDISREYPIPPKKGRIRTFFTAPSERRRLRKHKSRRILPLSNSSSSSIDTDLAYGTGFLKVKKRRRRTTRARREEGKNRSDDPDASILAWGAGLAAAAGKKSVEDWKAGRRREVFNALGRRSRDYDNGGRIYSPRSLRDHDEIIVDEEWESASEAESEASSHVDSTLAFGSNYGRRRGKSTVVDPRLFGPVNSLHGHVAEPVGFQFVDPNTVGVLSLSEITSEHYEDRHYEERRFEESIYQESTSSSRQPLRTVFPIPTTDPTRFEATRDSVVSAQEPVFVRPDPVPIQQPQPITPVSQSLYHQPSDFSLPVEKKYSSYGKSVAGAALAGMAVAAVGSMIATERNDDKNSSRENDRDERRKENSREADSSKRSSKRSGRHDGNGKRSSKRESRESKADRGEEAGKKDDEIPRGDWREKQRERRRESEREEDPEERRARRREERRAERSRVESYDDGRYRKVIEPPAAKELVDPFQFQVADDAFATPDISPIEAESSRRGRDPSPVVYTVEPEYCRMESSGDHVYDTPEFDRQFPPPRDNYRPVSRNTRDGPKLDSDQVTQREIEHSSDAAASAAFAARVAAVASIGGFRGSRSEKRRSERRGSRSYYNYKNAEVEVEDDQDRIIQREADRAYRKSVIARKAASKVIRERSPSPDAVDKYRRSRQDEVEEIRIVTPPAMEGGKQPGPYDAPNADFELDRVMDPTEFRVFSTPQITASSPIADPYETSTTAGYDFPLPGALMSRRPLLTLIRPTPTPSPALFPKAISPEPADSPPSEKGRDTHPRSQSAEDLVLDNKGDVRESPTPTSTTFSKAVTWGGNETKHYEVESPAESKDEFMSSPPREASNSTPSDICEESSGWRGVAGAIMGAAAGISIANVGISESSKPKPSRSDDNHEDHAVAVELEDSRDWSQRSPPAAVPRTTSMPGSFGDDIDFTATLAAGLQDSGFDPNIVIDDPSYRKRTSPPGSDEDVGFSYRKPFAETVSDLGENSSRIQEEMWDYTIPVQQQSTAETEVPKTAVESDTPRDEESTWKPSKKEREKRDKRARQDSGDDHIDHSTGALSDSDPNVLDEPESYVEPIKPTKKEQKKRDRATQMRDSASVYPAIPSGYTTSAGVAVAETGSYFGSGKPSRSKTSKVSVPIDAFDDIISSHAGTPGVTDDWQTPHEKQWRESERDAGGFASPSANQPTTDFFVPINQIELEPDPSSFPLPVSTISEPEPADFPLPMSRISQASRDENINEKAPNKSFRDNGIYDSDKDARTVVSASGYDEASRTSKKKSRSSCSGDDEDAKSVASAPAYDDFERKRKSKKKSRGSRYDQDDDTRSLAPASIPDNEDSKKSKKGGFFSLFGLSSKPEAEKKLDETIEAPHDDRHEARRKKSKSRRSSLPESSEFDGSAGDKSVTDLGSPTRNGSRRRAQDDDDNVADRRSSRRKLRSKGEKRTSSRGDQDSFLAKAGTLGAGVGLTGAAVAYAAHHLPSEAMNTNPDGADISLDTSLSPSDGGPEDFEISRRPFRPSIDPQYGDLLPLPPSNPSSPEMSPLDEVLNLPLPDSRPDTPESERHYRERNIHLARRPENQPLKSPSQSAIPLRFNLTNRSTPTSPEGLRSSSFGPPAVSIPDVVTPRSRDRPTSWDSTKEFKPLYLVAHIRQESDTGSKATESQLPVLKDLGIESPQPAEEEIAQRDAGSSASEDPESIGDSAGVVIPLEIQDDASSGQTETPPSKMHTPRITFDDDSPTPFQRDEPYDVSAARKLALENLSGKEAHELGISGSPGDSNAHAEIMQQVAIVDDSHTDADAVPHQQTIQEVASVNQSPAFPLEVNSSAMQPASAIVEPETFSEDAPAKPQKGGNPKKKKIASVVHTAGASESTTPEIESQVAQDGTTDSKEERELTAPGALAAMQTKHEPGTLAAAIDECNLESAAGASHMPKDEPRSFDHSDLPEFKIQKESNEQPANVVMEASSPALVPKANEYDSNERSAQSAELGDSLASTKIDSLAEFCVPKGKEGRKMSKSSAKANDIAGSPLELAVVATETIVFGSGGTSSREDATHHLEEGSNPSSIDKNDASDSETQPGPTDASSNLGIKAEEGAAEPAAGYEKDQLAPAKQLPEELGSGSTKNSKKGKGKKKSQPGIQAPETSTPSRENGVSHLHDSEDPGLEFEESKIAEDSNIPEDLEARRNVDQLESAPQLQAQLRSENNKSKEDREETLSSSRPAMDDLDAQEAGEQGDIQQAEPLASEPSIDATPSGARVEVRGTGDEYDDQLELARQLQASTQDTEPGTSIVAEHQQSLKTQDSAPDSASIDMLSGDGLTSSYNEEQLALAKQPDEELGSKSKLSKKEKKRQSLTRSSTMDEPSSDAVGEASKNHETSSPLSESSSVTEDNSKAAVSGEESHSSKRSKEKIRKSQLSHEITIDPENDVLPNDVSPNAEISADVEVEKEMPADAGVPEHFGETPVEAAVEIPMDPTVITEPQEEFASSSKKSRKKRDKRKSQLQANKSVEEDEKTAVEPIASSSQAADVEQAETLHSSKEEISHSTPALEQASFQPSRDLRPAEQDPKIHELADFLNDAKDSQAPEVIRDMGAGSTDPQTIVGEDGPVEVVVQRDTEMQKLEDLLNTTNDSPVSDVTRDIEAGSTDPQIIVGEYGPAEVVVQDLKSLARGENQSLTPETSEAQRERGISSQIEASTTHETEGLFRTVDESQEREIMTLEDDTNLAVDSLKQSGRHNGSGSLPASEDNMMAAANSGETGVPGESSPTTATHEQSTVEAKSTDQEPDLAADLAQESQGDTESKENLTELVMRGAAPEEIAQQPTQIETPDDLIVKNIELKEKSQENSAPVQERPGSALTEPFESPLTSIYATAEPTETPATESRTQDDTPMPDSQPSTQDARMDDVSNADNNNKKRNENLTAVPVEETPVEAFPAVEQAFPAVEAALVVEEIPAAEPHIENLDVPAEVAAVVEKAPVVEETVVKVAQTVEEAPVTGAALTSSADTDAEAIAPSPRDEGSLSLKDDTDQHEQTFSPGENQEETTAMSSAKQDHSTDIPARQSISEAVLQPDPIADAITTPEPDHSDTVTDVPALQSTPEPASQAGPIAYVTADLSDSTALLETTADLHDDATSHSIEKHDSAISEPGAQAEKQNVLYSTPIAEELENKMISSPPRNKKKKKTNRASAVLGAQDSEIATASSTPAEPAMVPSGLEDTAASQPLNPLISDQTISVLTNEDSGFSSGKKSKKNRGKKRASTGPESSAYNTTNTSTPVKAAVELRNNPDIVEVAQSIPPPVVDSRDRQGQPISEPPSHVSEIPELETGFNIVGDVPSQTVEDRPENDSTAFSRLDSLLSSSSVEQSRKEDHSSNAELSKLDKLFSQFSGEPASGDAPGSPEPSKLEKLLSQLDEEQPAASEPIGLPEPGLDDFISRYAEESPESTSLIEQPIRDEGSAAADITTVDKLLSQFSEEPASGNAPGSPEPSKLEKISSQLGEEQPAASERMGPPESRHDDIISRSVGSESTTPVVPASINERFGNEAGQYGTEATNESVQIFGKKSKKDKKKRKSSLGQKNVADSSGTSSPSKQAPANLKDIQAQANEQLVNDEPPHAMETRNLEDTSSQPSCEPAIEESEISISKKSKKKNKRKTVSEQLYETFSPGEPSTIVEPVSDPSALDQSPANLEGIQDEAAEELVKDESPDAVESQNLGDTPSQPSCDPAVEEFEISSSKKSKKKNKRKSGSRQIHDARLDGSSTLTEPIPDLSARDLSSEESAERAVYHTTEEYITPNPETEPPTLAQPVSDPSARVQTNSEEFAERGVDYAQEQNIIPTPEAEPSTQAKPVPDPSVLDQTNAEEFAERAVDHTQEQNIMHSPEVAAREADEHTTLDSFNDAGVSNIAEQNIEFTEEIDSSTPVTEAEAGNAAEDFPGFSAPERPEKHELVTAEVPDNANSAPADSAPTIDQDISRPWSFYVSSTAGVAARSPEFGLSHPESDSPNSQANLDAETNDPMDEEWGPVPSQKKKNDKNDKEKRKGTLDLVENDLPAESSKPSLEDAEQSKEISLDKKDPRAGEPKDNFGLSAGDKSDKDEAKQEEFNAAENPYSTAKTHSKVDQISPDDDNATTPNDLGLFAIENDDAEQLDFEEPRCLVEIEVRLSGDKSSDDENVQKMPMFSDAPGSTGHLEAVQPTATLDDQLEQPSELSDQPAKVKGAEDSSQSENEWASPTSKKSKRKKSKRKGSDMNSLLTPTLSFQTDGTLMEESQAPVSSFEKDENIISVPSEEAPRGESHAEDDLPEQDPESNGPASPVVLDPVGMVATQPECPPEDPISQDNAVQSNDPSLIPIQSLDENTLDNTTGEVSANSPVDEKIISVPSEAASRHESHTENDLSVQDSEGNGPASPAVLEPNDLVVTQAEFSSEEPIHQEGKVQSIDTPVIPVQTQDKTTFDNTVPGLNENSSDSEQNVKLETQSAEVAQEPSIGGAEGNNQAVQAPESNGPASPAVLKPIAKQHEILPEDPMYQDDAVDTPLIPIQPQGVKAFDNKVPRITANSPDEAMELVKQNINAEIQSAEVPEESNMGGTKGDIPAVQAPGDDGGFSSGKRSKGKKKRKLLRPVSPGMPVSPTSDTYKIAYRPAGIFRSKELHISTGGTEVSDSIKKSPKADSEFSNISRTSSNRSKKRGNSEVDSAAAKVASDELAASIQEPGILVGVQQADEDVSAPSLKRGHSELLGGQERDLATPDAEGASPLLRAQFHSSQPAKGSTKQVQDDSDRLKSAAKFGTGMGLGVVAGLAARFEPSKKAKPGERDIGDHATTQDHLLDDPALPEGAQTTVLTESASAEDAPDDGFWAAPGEVSNDDITMKDASSSNPLEFNDIHATVADIDLAQSRDIQVDPEQIPSLPEKVSETPASLQDAPAMSLNENSSTGEHFKGKSQDHSYFVHDELDSKSKDELNELKIPKTRNGQPVAYKVGSDSQLQESCPTASIADLCPVAEESSQQAHSQPTVRQEPPELDSHRESTLVDESPVPVHHGFLHNYIRDSGVQLRDGSNSPAERKPEAVTDQAIQRLSWPRVDNNSETVDLVGPRNPSVKAELDKHINDIALDVVAVTARETSPKREHKHVRPTPSPRSLGFVERSQRPQTPRSSLGVIPRLHTPDHSRAPSTGSVSSLASNLPPGALPPLRRTDHPSADLRSLSQRSEASSVNQPQLDDHDDKLNKANAVSKVGQVHGKDMADVYEAYGQGRIGSPMSPTRPPSMRRRQSMKVLDLEAQLHQLAEENRMLSEGKTQTEQSLYAAQRAAATLADRDAEIDILKQTIDWLHREVSRLTEVNDGLSNANVTMGNQHNERYNTLETQYNKTARDLHELEQSHANVADAMDGLVQHDLENTVEEKNREIARLYAELEEAKEQVRELQKQILAAKADNSEFLTIRDEDYFDEACQKLCTYVQQWVLRFSKFSDMRACRLTSEISDEPIINRLDNAVLDGSDVDVYLSDRVKRRDIFMSMTMMMVWEFVFTRYLFGMDREQRQKLKSLEKLLSEVGPQSAVHLWRATTLTLLSKRPAFLSQREQDTEAVVQEIFNTLSEILPPPSQVEGQLQDQLRRVMKAAVELSIEMRTQRAEYMMLPPLKPEYDANGDLERKFPFNAALMNERSGDTTSNEELEEQGAVVRVVLFPLVVKKGDDRGEGDEEIVVCPAQVLVAREHKRRSASGRNFSGHSGVMMSANNGSKLSVQSSMSGAVSRDGSPS